MNTVAPIEAKKPNVTFSKITFQNGQEVELGPNDKVLIVGPNNSGKSQLLRELHLLASHHRESPTLVASSLEIRKTGTSVELKRFLEEFGEREKDHFRYRNWSIPTNFVDQFETSPNLPHGLADGFIKNITSSDRLTICNQQKNVGEKGQRNKPQHLLYFEPDLMEKISRLFEQAFGQSLMINYLGGQTIPIHVGEKPGLDAGQDRVGKSYVDAVKKNPLLDEQGDGVRSYAGILFEAVASDYDVVMIDEPEAFLHPPQMRRLAETLSTEVKGQLIVATHSNDVVSGFLSGSSGSVRVLRISRQDDNSIVTEIKPEKVLELWSKPELRYSNALDALFHDRVVLCEDESDCKLYNAVADYLESRSPITWPDTSFTPCGGKHGAPKIAEILSLAGVPVFFFTDIDFLSEVQNVKKTIEALCGNWNEFSRLVDRLDKSVRDGVTKKSTTEISDEIRSILDSVDEDEDIPRSKISEVMKQKSEWQIVKKGGTTVIPRGDAQKVFAELDAKLKEIGIFVVPKGEAEGFCLKIGGHGPKFVDQLLREVSLENEDLEDLRNFVGSALAPSDA